MTQDTNGALRETVHAIHRYIGENLYFSRPDLEIRGKKFNAALLLSLLTGLRQGKALIIGEPGLGKTTSAEYICSLLYGLPLGTVWASEVSGHPEQTEEKIIGRPDLGRLNQGEEVVVWSHFVLLPAKIVDEINRLPETKQSMILDGVDRGNWEYLNDAVINSEYCLFATANYQDGGTHTIIAPLIDRFDVMVESKHPGPNLAFHIGMGGSNGTGLRNEAMETELHRVLNQRIPYKDRMDQVEELSNRFGEAVERELGVRTLSRPDRETIRSGMNEIPLDVDTNAFLRLVLAELSFCSHYGQRRFHEGCAEGCHFTSYLCNTVRNCISNRFPSSTRALSQALAWFMGDKQVGLEHVKAILPFTLAHRIQWKEETLARREKESRRDPLPIYMAREAVREMHRRYIEQADRLKSALAIACRISDGEPLEPVEGDHPIYWEIRRDLGEEVLDS